MITRNFWDFPGVRWSTQFDEIDRMRRGLDNLVNNLRGVPYRSPGAGVFPLVNLTENADNYFLRAELPGVPAENLDIQSAHNNITITGERKLPEEDQNARYHRREREAGQFSRAIKLPGEIDNDKIEAALNNGVLTVTIPKAETAKPKQIQIK